jgi:ubiquinone/menaquinone biosynthesis C-methylase UbiE
MPTFTRGETVSNTTDITLNIKSVDMHADNERMFDRSSVEYSTETWFDTTARSSYAYSAAKYCLLKLLQTEERDNILEIGCGPGTWTRGVAERGAQITAVDISSQMIARARRFVPPYDVTFVHSDVLSFQAGRRFRRVFSSRAIEYVRDQQQLAHHLAGLVGDGGTLVLITKTRISLWRGRQWLRGARARLRRATRRRGASTPIHTDAAAEFAGGYYMQRLSPGYLAGMLRHAGFEDVTVHPCIVGLPILAGVEGDLPLLPRRFTHLALATFNRLGIALFNAPQWVMPLITLFTESYALRATRGRRTTTAAGSPAAGSRPR